MPTYQNNLQSARCHPLIPQWTTLRHLIQRPTPSRSSASLTKQDPLYSILRPSWIPRLPQADRVVWRYGIRRGKVPRTLARWNRRVPTIVALSRMFRRIPYSHRAATWDSKVHKARSPQFSKAVDNKWASPRVLNSTERSRSEKGEYSNGPLGTGLVHWPQGWDIYIT